MNHPRRRFLRAGATVLAGAALPRLAWAQGYPVRPVHVIVGFPAGGLTDITARVIGQRLAEELGEQFVVDNRPGAASNIGTEVVVRALADGYTLLLATALNAINATVYDKLPFDFIRDMVPVASLVDAAFVMQVNPSVPAKTVPEFVAYAKANPGKINYASAGAGSPENVAAELFKMMAGIDLLHVPYRGSAPALTDLVGGQVQVMFGPIAPSIDHIRAGKLRALAVTTATPSESLPDVPTLNTFLPGFAVSAWQGLVAPRGTPADVIHRLNESVNAALADAKLRARFGELGLTAMPGSSADFAKLIANDTEKWAKVVTSAGIKAE